MKRAAEALVFLAVIVTVCPAQVTTGRVEETVTDSQGAVVPGAAVKVVNSQTEFALRLNF